MEVTRDRRILRSSHNRRTTVPSYHHHHHAGSVHQHHYTGHHICPEPACRSNTPSRWIGMHCLRSVGCLHQHTRSVRIYIRLSSNLLPADNFSPSHFTSEDDSVSTELSEGSTPGSGRSSSIRQNINGFKIMVGGIT